MNKFTIAFFYMLFAVATVFGAEFTDYVNNAGNTSTGSTGVDPDSLTGNSYVGSTGTSAANISNISELQVNDSSFSGGSAGTVASDSTIAIVGGAGLEVANVGQTTVSTAGSIKGGSGGVLTMTTAGTRTGDATGGNAALFSSTTPGDTLKLQNGNIIGGNGGVVLGASANTVSANGGSALYADSGTLSIVNGFLRGGNGGTALAPGGVADAVGGHGVNVNFSFVKINSLSDGFSATGGKGGSADAGDGDAADASGGGGVSLRWQVGVISGDKPIVVNGGSYTGGAGGVADSGGSSIANGGVGFDMLGGQSVIISNGTFTGGAGGVANSTSATDTPQADGGAGAHIVFANNNIFGSGAAKAEIYGGVFNGGAAGKANGAAGEVGYGLVLESSDTLIDGNVQINGRGLRVDSFGIPSKTVIKDAVITEAIFTSEVNSEYPGFPATPNSFIVAGGMIGDVYIGGTGGNNGTFTGGTIADIMVGGSGNNVLAFGGNVKFGDLYLGESAVNSLSFSNGVVSSGVVRQSAGTSDVSVWSDDHFMDTIISGGTMNFNNQAFTLQKGSTMVLQDDTTGVNFNNGARIGDGATLDIGLGTVGGAGNFVADSGSTIKTWLIDDGAGVANGLIEGQNLTFQTGTVWKVAGPAGNAVDKIKLASASSSVVDNGIAFEYTPTKLWYLGIVGTSTAAGGLGTDFYADLGDLPWNEALDAPAGSGYEAALQDLSLVATNGSTAYNILVGIPTKQDAQNATLAAWGRTAEVGSSLLGFQSIIADQVKDRSRTYLHPAIGSLALADSAPVGAAGPSEWYDNTVNWMHDHLPSRDLRDDLSRIGKPAPGEASPQGNEYDAVVYGIERVTPESTSEIIEIPESYQVWGRGYGSFIQQKETSGFFGYDASVAGGIIGADKVFENALLGIGGGYARTDLRGNAHNDAEVDTGYGVGYFSMNKESLFVDASASYGYSSVDVSTYMPSASGYQGNYDAHTAGFYLGGGYGMPVFNDSILFTPEASILAAYYNRGAYTETSPVFSTKSYDSYDEWSYLGSLGATLTMLKKFNAMNLEMTFQPEVRVHWLHEFNNEMGNEEYTLVGIPGGGQRVGVELQAREEDLLRLGAGVRFAKWAEYATSFGVDVDGEIGSDYEALIVSGKIMHQF